MLSWCLYQYVQWFIFIVFSYFSSAFLSIIEIILKVKELIAKQTECLQVIDDYLTEKEYGNFLQEIDGYMKRKRYEYSHWDDVCRS